MYGRLLHWDSSQLNNIRHDASLISYLSADGLFSTKGYATEELEQQRDVFRFYVKLSVHFFLPVTTSSSPPGPF